MAAHQDAAFGGFDEDQTDETRALSLLQVSQRVIDAQALIGTPVPSRAILTILQRQLQTSMDPAKDLITLNATLQTGLEVLSFVNKTVLDLLTSTYLKVQENVLSLSNIHAPVTDTGADPGAWVSDFAEKMQSFLVVMKVRSEKIVSESAAKLSEVRTELYLAENSAYAQFRAAFVDMAAVRDQTMLVARDVVARTNTSEEVFPFDWVASIFGGGASKFDKLQHMVEKANKTAGQLIAHLYRVNSTAAPLLMKQTPAMVLQIKRDLNSSLMYALGHASRTLPEPIQKQVYNTFQGSFTLMDSVPEKALAAAKKVSADITKGISVLPKIFTVANGLSQQIAQVAEAAEKEREKTMASAHAMGCGEGESGGRC